MTKIIGFVLIVSGCAWWVPAARAAEPATQPAAAPSASAKYVTTDTTTQGYWKCRYGTDGYVVVGDAQKLPDYAKVAVLTDKGDAKEQYNEYTVVGSSAIDSALQKAEGSDRIIAHWGSAGGMTIDVNLTDNQEHRVALYWLNYSKPLSTSEKVELLDADTEAVLDTRKVTRYDAGYGLYLIWDIKGHVKIRVTNTEDKGRAAINGLFFGQRAATPAASAKFVATDTTTQGSWKGVYGTDGYVIAGDAQKLPDYAKFAILTEKGKEGDPSPTSGDRYIEGIWARSTPDGRALQKAEGADRVAVMWGSYRGITLDVNLTDNQTHRLALYFLDFRKGYLSAKIEVLDADTCAVLDTQNVKNPVDGQHLVWDIKGHVRIRMTNTSEGRVPFCGLFLGQGSASPPARELALDLGNNVAMKLTFIPASAFMRGSPDKEKDRDAGAESPQHWVTITRPLYMGVYEVTQAQYEQVMGKNPSTHKDPAFPVGNVGWSEAAEFCQKASAKTDRTVRLPTEAEWEFACRAGTNTRFHFGDNEEKLGDYAWTARNSDDKPHPVGQKKPNAFGLYDVHGNVSEWVRDFRDNYPQDKKAVVVDPRGPDESNGGHVIRGGSFHRDCSPSQCRSAYRGVEEGKDMKSDPVGFRVVVNVK